MSKKNIQSELEAAVEALDETAGTLTPDSIAIGIETAMDALSETFVEQGVRVRADNGKLYRTLDGIPEDVTPSQVEHVNELAYIQRQIASVLPWKLETMLSQNTNAQADARRQLAWARRQVAEGKADEWLVESKDRFVGQLEYQQAILETAFGAAMRGYKAAIGEDYVTAAERQAARIRGQARTQAASEPSSKAAAYRAAA